MEDEHFCRWDCPHQGATGRGREVGGDATAGASVWSADQDRGEALLAQDTPSSLLATYAAPWGARDPVFAVLRDSLPGGRTGRPECTVYTGGGLMAYATLIAVCYRCHNTFSANPARVPSLRLPTGDQAVFCRACVEQANPVRIAKGLAPIPTAGAYEVEETA